MPGITIITQLPSFLGHEAYEEMTSSTPASFAQIPARLYYEAQNVSLALDPAFNGFSQTDCASGTLYVLSR